MKVAIYIVNNTTQIVLTPEEKFETASLDHLHAPNSKLTVLRGSFYETRGGWYRESADDQSTMLRIDTDFGPTPPQVDVDALRARIEQLEGAVYWACGVNGEFDRPDNARGAFWWRTELRERAGISAEQLNARAALAD